NVGSCRSIRSSRDTPQALSKPRLTHATSLARKHQPFPSNGHARPRSACGRLSIYRGTCAVPRVTHLPLGTDAAATTALSENPQNSTLTPVFGFAVAPGAQTLPSQPGGLQHQSRQPAKQQQQRRALEPEDGQAEQRAGECAQPGHHYYARPAADQRPQQARAEATRYRRDQ